MMASDMNWTTDLGNAFLGQQQEVMFAVQRMRQRARDYGYLRTGPQIIVGGGPYITIMPARVDYVVVPTYDPVVVYERPASGLLHRRRNWLPFWRGAGSCLSAMGMGLQPHCLGPSRGVHQ